MHLHFTYGFTGAQDGGIPITTGVKSRIRHGASTASPVLYESPVYAVNGDNPLSICIDTIDHSGWVGQQGGGQYCVTLQQAGPTESGQDGTVLVFSGVIEQ